MDTATKVLKKLLKINPLPAMEGRKRLVWPEVGAILDKIDEIPDHYGQKQLTSYVAYAITLIPQTPEALTDRKVKAFLVLLGKVLNHHIKENTTYVIEKGKIRKLIQSHLFSNAENPYNAMLAWFRARRIKFDNADRTIASNVKMKAVKTARMHTIFNITQNKLREIVSTMIEDANGPDPDAIILLTQLCLGVRIGEAVMASKFRYLGEKPNLRTTTVKSNMPAPETVHMIEQHGILKRKRGANTNNEEDTANIKCIKPVLYVGAEWLLTKLNEWRTAHGITAELTGTYNAQYVDRHNRRINKLLQTKYLSSQANNAIRIKTHLLRALYAASSFDLSGDPEINQNAHNKNVLCHQDYETSASYDYVSIVPSTD